MADKTTKRQQSFDAYLKEKSAEVERRKNLFDALNTFVSRQGGWVASVPGAKYVRIECRKNSDLPSRLQDLGYAPRHYSIGTRIIGGAFVPTDIIEIALGK